MSTHIVCNSTCKSAMAAMASSAYFPSSSSIKIARQVQIFSTKNSNPFPPFPKHSTNFNIIVPLSSSQPSPSPEFRPPIQTGRFLNPDDLERLQFLESYSYIQELKSGFLYMRLMEKEEIDLTAGLLAESFAESLFIPKGYEKFLAYLVKQYLTERNAYMPHAATLLGFYRGDEDEDFQVAGTVEVSFSQRGFNVNTPSPVPPKCSPYICNMTVKESLRRRGIAWHMLKAAEELITQLGSCNEAFLHCRMIDEAPLNMYMKAGYKIVKSDSLWVLLTLQRRKHLMYKQIPAPPSPPEPEVDMDSEEPNT